MIVKNDVVEAILLRLTFELVLQSSESIIDLDIFLTQHKDTEHNVGLLNAKLSICLRYSSILSRMRFWTCSPS